MVNQKDLSKVCCHFAMPVTLSLHPDKVGPGFVSMSPQYGNRKRSDKPMRRQKYPCFKQQHFGSISVTGLLSTNTTIDHNSRRA